MIIDGQVAPEAGEPTVVFCVDEFGPLNLQPRPGRQRAGVGGAKTAKERARRRQRRWPVKARRPPCHRLLLLLPLPLRSHSKAQAVRMPATWSSM
nr:hypothetical protein [Frankia tisae]